MAQDLELALRIRADVQQALREVRGLRGDVQQFGQGAEQSARRLERLESTSDRVGASFRRLRGVIAGLGIGLLAREIVRADDAYTRLRGRLRLVTESEQQLQRVEQQLFETAQRTRGAYEATVELYARTAQSARQLGLSQDRLLQITETTNQAIAISGASAQEAQAGVIQFSQAIAAGTLRGEELNSVLEQLPRLAQAIGAGLVELGVAANGSVGEIRALAEEGRLTSEVVVEALLSQQERIAEEFGQLERTVGQAMTQLINDLQRASAAGDLSPVVDAIDDVREVITDPAFVSGFSFLISNLARLVGVAGRAAGALAKVAEETRTFGRRIGDAFGDGLQGQERVDLLRDRISSLTEELERLEEQQSRIGPVGRALGADNTEQIETYRRRLEEARAELESLLDTQSRQASAAALPMELVLPGLQIPGAIEAPPPALAGGGADDAAAEAAAEAREQLQSLSESLREQVATFDQGQASVLEYRLTLGELADEVERLGPQGERLREQILQQARALDALQRQEEEAAAARRERQQLEREGERLAQSLRTAQERYNDELERYRTLLAAGAIDQETFNRAVEGAKTRLEEAGNKAAETGDSLSEFAIQGARNAQSAFADFLFDPFDSGLQGMVRGFADAIRRMASEALAARALQGILSALPGGGGAAFQGVMAAVRHTGGIAGAPGPSREVPAWLFGLAPRYHSGGIAGLQADEVPAVLQRGEEVLTEADPRHRDNLQGSASRLEMQLGLDEGIILRALRSREGEKAIVQTIGRNRRSVRQELG